MHFLEAASSCKKEIVNRREESQLTNTLMLIESYLQKKLRLFSQKPLQSISEVVLQ